MGGQWSEAFFFSSHEGLAHHGHGSFSFFYKRSFGSVVFLQKHAPLLSTSYSRCLGAMTATGRGNTKKEACSKGGQMVLDVDGWEREALKTSGIQRGGRKGNKKGDTCWELGLGLCLIVSRCREIG